MNRTVLVTGGTGALGRAIVQRLVARGARVHVPWVAEREVPELESLLGASFREVKLHRTDVTTEEGVATLFQEIAAGGRHVEVLANIVGAFAYAGLEKTDLGIWNRMMQLNATSAFLCCRAAVPAMKHARWGRMVNVSSAPAVNHGAANMSAYAAAKAAVLNFSESLSKELVGFGITVNALVPSVIDTPANRKAEPAADTSRWLLPDEIAGVVEFLAGDAAMIVTGTAVNLTRG